MKINLKVFRIKRHLTQADMAALIGVSRVTYSNIERGRNNASEDFWKKLQAEFEIPDSEMYSLMKNAEDVE